MILEDVMIQAMAAASPDEPVARAVERMHLFRTPLLVVLNVDDSVLGVITERDARAAPQSALVAFVMSRDLLELDVTTPLADAVRAARGRPIACIVAKRQGAVVGTVTIAGLLARLSGGRSKTVRAESVSRA